MTDRTPIVLALLADLLRDRSVDAPEDADLHHLATGVTLAVDHIAVADLWPPTGDDEVIASNCVVTILGTAQPADGHDLEGVRMIAVARRLADVAASLCVRGDAWKDEAFALWDAASRLSGFEAVRHRVAQNFVDNLSSIAAGLDSEAKAPYQHDDLRARRIFVDSAKAIRWNLDRVTSAESDAMTRMRDERDEARDEVARLTRAHAEEVARLTEQLATARADLEEALRSTVSAAPYRGLKNMSEQTHEVARLDRSKPPPGYIVDGAQWQHVESGHWGIAGTEEVEHLGAEAAATAAWAHHEQHNDPPGCHEIFNCALGMEAHGRVRRGWKFRFGIASGEVGYADVSAARAAAWAWYWRRVAVSVRLSAGMWAPLTCECSKPPASWGGRGASLCEHVAERLRIRTADFWPRLLAYPDDQVAEVERWLVEGGELPEVLR